MRLDKAIEGISIIDNPQYLRSVNSSTLLDSSTGRYIISTTKGLKKLYVTIGMFDNIFVEKLRKLDESYCEKQINSHLQSVSDEYTFFEMDNILRVMENDRYEALTELLSKFVGMYKSASCNFSNDVLYIDSNLSPYTDNKYLVYNFISNKLDICTYRIHYYNDDRIPCEFIGIPNYTVKLDDPRMIPMVETHDVYSYVKDSMEKVLYWSDANKIAKGLKSRVPMVDAMRMDSFGKEGLSDYNLRSVSKIVYGAYKEAPEKMMRYIEQFDYAFNHSVEDTREPEVIIVDENSNMIHKVA